MRLNNVRIGRLHHTIFKFLSILHLIGERKIWTQNMGGSSGVRGGGGLGGCPPDKSQVAIGFLRFTVTDPLGNQVDVLRLKLVQPFWTRACCRKRDFDTYRTGEQEMAQTSLCTVAVPPVPLLFAYLMHGRILNTLNAISCLQKKLHDV